MSSTMALRPGLIGKLNEQQILRTIQQRGSISRAELARLTSLSAPTVSKAVLSLLQAGLVEEFTPLDKARGRPAASLRLASASTQVLAVAVDADICKVALAGLDGAVLHESDPIPTPATYAELLDVLQERCEAIQAERPGATTLGVGLSLPGLIDDRAERGVLSPNMPYTNGNRPAKDLADRLGMPGVLVQESHALCLAELHYGAAKGRDHFAVMEVGVGVGLGVMNNGRLLTGQHGFAGEIGHLTVQVEGGRRCGCGNTGCLETLCNEAAFAALMSQACQRQLSCIQAIELYRQAPGQYTEAIQPWVQGLVVALAAVVNVLNPAAVYIHSRLLDIEDTLLARVVSQVRTRALRPAVELCQFHRSRGTKILGAIAAIVHDLTEAVARPMERIIQ
jgi:N-acetylglucosamine repressor